MRHGAWTSGRAYWTTSNEIAYPEVLILGTVVITDTLDPDA